jgi:hypothetical protein
MVHVERWNSGPDSGCPDLDEKEFRPVCEAVKVCLSDFGSIRGLGKHFFVLEDENTWDRTQLVEVGLPQGAIDYRIIEALQQTLWQTNPLWRIALCRGTGFHRESIWIYPDYYYTAILSESNDERETRVCPQLSVEDVFRHWLKWARDDSDPMAATRRYASWESVSLSQEQFRNLVDTALLWSKEFAIFKTPMSDRKDRLLMRLLPYAIEIRHRKCWPDGLIRPEWAYAVYKIDHLVETARILVEECPSPFELATLGGMGFLRPEGSLWFFADAVKQQCRFTLTEDEKLIVEEWISLTTT